VRKFLRDQIAAVDSFHLHRLLPVLLVVVSAFAFRNAQLIPVVCEFVEDARDGSYACELSGITIVNDINQNFTIGGTHLSGRTNDDVLTVNIVFADIPFVFKEIFETFANVRRLTVNKGGLITFQPRAFFKATNLLMIELSQNFLPTLYPHAFIGATNVEILFLSDNSVQMIDEHALVGLNSLVLLHLNANQIAEFPLNLLRPAIRLTAIVAANNIFTRLNGDVFARKYQINQVSFARNQINAIERSFLDNLNGINILNFSANRCIDSNFVLSPTVTVGNVSEALTSCFSNFDNLGMM
jgi:Leucine-rich repeat (LRR) protein